MIFDAERLSPRWLGLRDPLMGSRYYVLLPERPGAAPILEVLDGDLRQIWFWNWMKTPSDLAFRIVRETNDFLRKEQSR